MIDKIGPEIFCRKLKVVEKFIEQVVDSASVSWCKLFKHLFLLLKIVLELFDFVFKFDSEFLGLTNTNILPLIASA